MRNLVLVLLSIAVMTCGNEVPETDSFVLDNGLKVTLAKMPSEEVFIGLYAKEGYASLPKEKVVSGRIADHIAWNSGIGDKNTDQIAYLLYNKNIEFSAEIYSLHRAMQGRCPKGETKQVFELMRTLFAEPRFSKEAFDQEVARRKKKLLNQPPTWSKTLDRAFLLMNTNNFYPYETISFENLQTADFETSRDFYRKAFSNPREFHLIIVGEIDPEAMREQLQDTLATLAPTSDTFTSPTLPPFPTNHPIQSVPIQNRTSSTMRLAFPVNEIFDCKSYRKLLTLSHLVETHLKRMIAENNIPIHGLSANLELPYYPHVANAWITLQFQGDFETLNNHISTLVKEMQAVTDAPISADELAALEDSLDKTYTRWQTPQEYWFTTLSNAALFGWGWQQLAQPPPKSLSPDTIHHLYKDLLQLDRYSVIATKPE
ncbi:MAG: insulinase family protein [Chlamydiia bacterium]|nr:insulinase family protein [Chlamydiia bacterium]